MKIKTEYYLIICEAGVIATTIAIKPQVGYRIPDVYSPHVDNNTKQLKFALGGYKVIPTIDILADTLDGYFFADVNDEPTVSKLKDLKVGDWGSCSRRDSFNGGTMSVYVKIGEDEYLHRMYIFSPVRVLDQNKDDSRQDFNRRYQYDVVDHGILFPKNYYCGHFKKLIRRAFGASSDTVYKMNFATFSQFLNYTATTIIKKDFTLDDIFKLYFL